jgi:release factor glutamine methyltransferase
MRSSAAPLHAWRRQLARFMRLGYRLSGQLDRTRTRLEHIDGLEITVLPGVFNPRLMRSGAWFVEVIARCGLRPDRRVLDLGTGSGICAVAAARAGTCVTAIDINPAALHCARANARANGVANRIRVLQGDLFAPVAGERFDLVLFNPPFLRGTPADDADRAWRSTDVPERFAAGLRAHLTPGGRALLLLSSWGGEAMFLAAVAQQGLGSQLLASRDYFNETLRVWEIRGGAPDSSTASCAAAASGVASRRSS